MEVDVRVRYKGDETPGVVRPIGSDGAEVEFRSPQRAIAPGQSVVLYCGDEVLGGGVIARAIR
jgi:tRNA-specific 2-thiouridylase